MRIFLSYHTPDSRVAEALKGAVEAAMPGAEVFVAHRDLRYGAPWQPQLSASIASADAFIILLGSKIGRWQLPEYYAAHNRMVTQPDFKLVPVLTAEDTPPLPFLSSIHYLKANNPASEPALSQIVAALKGEAGIAQQQLWMSVNPYRGLESLREEDADFFFGREDETAAALNLLASPVNGIVTLIGNSGVGKSSLVEAGVFAALRRQALPGGGIWPSALRDSREWATITMRPGEDPIQALVSAFMDLWFGDMTDPDRIGRRNRWAALFRDGEAPLRDIVQATHDRFEKELALPAPRRILLNINQAEELYSLTPEPSRAAFSRLLAQALTDRRIAVVASLRADYYGNHQGNAPLFDHMARVDVRPFGEDGLKRVIDGPAAVLGATFESGELADFIVRGAADQAGALPLLAFYMTDLWDRMQKRGDGVLRLADKAEMVDVGRALTSQADRFLAEHPADIDAVKRLFTLKLALVQEEGKAVRRRVPRARLNDAEWALIEALCEPRWRLVTTGEDDAGGAYAEVAHEVLLQSWATLVAWLESEREFLSFKARAERDRSRWERQNRARPALLSGLDLIQAEQWLATRARDFDPEDADYIRESVRVRDAERTAAERFRRRVLRGSVAAAVVMTAVSAFAGWEWLQAKERVKFTDKTVGSLFETMNDTATQPEEKQKNLMRLFVNLFQPDAESGSSNAMVIMGSFYLNLKGDGYVEARKWFQKAADAGNAKAMLNLGLMWERAQGSDGNPVEARRWYQKGANAGDAEAMNNLGNCWHNGYGGGESFDEARKWYEKAAGARNADAMRALGGLAQKGEGVDTNAVEARKWYQKAIDAGNTDALVDLGQLLERGEGGDRDPAKARNLYEKAAIAGNTTAMNDLGLLWEKGEGGDRNLVEARRWFQKAAEADDTHAMVVLGILWEQGEGGEKSASEARRWFGKAAEAGNADAMVNLGVLLEKGEGGGADPAEARKWYEEAANASHATGMANLGYLWEKGEGGDKSAVEARKWYQKAVDAGDAEAMQKLALLFRKGEGGPQDFRAAQDLLRNAAETSEAAETAGNGKPGPQTASAYTSISFESLFLGDFEGAAAAADKAYALDATTIVPLGNKAHALMFLGREAQARALYLQYKGQAVPALDGITWDLAVLNDFAELESAGLTLPPLAAEIRAAFASAPPAAN